MYPERIGFFIWRSHSCLTYQQSFIVFRIFQSWGFSGKMSSPPFLLFSWSMRAQWNLCAFLLPVGAGRGLEGDGSLDGPPLKSAEKTKTVQWCLSHDGWWIRIQSILEILTKKKKNNSVRKWPKASKKSDLAWSLKRRAFCFVFRHFIAFFYSIPNKFWMTCKRYQI